MTEFEDVMGNPMVFALPSCWKHRRGRWWCRKCQRVVAAEFQDTVHAMWTAQGHERPVETPAIKETNHE